jgi:hypothetical protein
MSTRAHAVPKPDPAQAAQRARRRRPRAVLLGVAAAVVAVAGLGVPTLGREGSSLLERAQAALEPEGRILHVVVRVVDGGTATRGESWVSPDGSTGRSVEGFGATAVECQSSATRLRCFDPARNVIDVYRYHPEAVAEGRQAADVPQFRIDRPESLSPALGAGYARLIGDDEIEGRRVFVVLLAIPHLAEDGSASPRFLEGRSPTLYVDRETYTPVAQRFPDGGSTTYYETFEFLPDDAANRPLLLLSAPSDARVVVHPVGEGPQP